MPMIIHRGTSSPFYIELPEMGPTDVVVKLVDPTEAKRLQVGYLLWCDLECVQIAGMDHRQLTLVRGVAATVARDHSPAIWEVRPMAEEIISSMADFAEGPKVKRPSKCPNCGAPGQLGECRYCGVTL
jgi:hypothetical protein